MLRPLPAPPHEQSAYQQEAAELRTAVAEFMFAAGVSSEGYGVTVHFFVGGLEDLDTALDPHPTFSKVLLCNKRPYSRYTMEPGEIHIVTNEVYVASEPEAFRIKIAHMHLSAANRAILRHHIEILDLEKTDFVDRTKWGPIVNGNKGKINYDEKQLRQITKFHEEDRHLNAFLGDQVDALRHGRAILDLLGKGWLKAKKKF